MEPHTVDVRTDDAVIRRDVAVVGASAGGVEALQSLARGLPADSPLAVVVVLHMPTGAHSKLGEILGRAGPLPAVPATHGARVEPGRIYVAQPDYHLVLSDSRMFQLDGPRENGFRPAIDPLFRSAARTLGPRAIGVLLSGTMDDGVAGLAAIQAFGGATVVQDPDDALASGMPRAALEMLEPDHVGPATSMGRVLDDIAKSDVRVPKKMTNREDPTLVADPLELEPEGVDLACPECGGALQQITAGSIPRFRCRTGHVYSPNTLLEHKSIELEGALWAALRALEEEASMAGRLAERSQATGAPAAARRFSARQGDAAQRADLVREAIHSIGAAARTSELENVAEGNPGVAEAS